MYITYKISIKAITTYPKFDSNKGKKYAGFLWNYMWRSYDSKSQNWFSPMYDDSRWSHRKIAYIFTFSYISVQLRYWSYGMGSHIEGIVTGQKERYLKHKTSWFKFVTSDKSSFDEANSFVAGFV